jgi:hypothetical protein
VIDAMTRHEIQVLRAAGIPEHVVAQRTAVSVRSVERSSPRAAANPSADRIRPSRRRRALIRFRRSFAVDADD